MSSGQSNRLQLHLVELWKEQADLIAIIHKAGPVEGLHGCLKAEHWLRTDALMIHARTLIAETQKLALLLLCPCKLLQPYLQ